MSLIVIYRYANVKTGQLLRILSFFLIAVAHVYVSHIFPIHYLAPWKKNTRAKWTWTNDLFLRLLICLGLHAPACPYVGCPRWHHLRLHCAAQPDWFLSNRLCVGRGGGSKSSSPLHRTSWQKKRRTRYQKKVVVVPNSTHIVHSTSFSPPLCLQQPPIFSTIWRVYIFPSFFSLPILYVPHNSLSLSLSKSTRVTHLSLERKREEEEEKSLNLGLIYETKMARDSLVV